MRTVCHIGLCAAALGFVSSASAQTPVAATPTYLNQGWSDAQRQQFYTISQGSELLPLNWFLALERTGSEEMFLADGLARFGYLPNPASAANPHGLPVGFTEDKNAGTWLGLTCAACHTSQINYHGSVIRIDGGSTDADIYAFLSELSKALVDTVNDPAKFGRFATRVGANEARTKRDLHNELSRFAAYFATFVDASAPTSLWGPARADAFGMIFNRVAAIDLAEKPYWAWFQSLESNYQVPDAPVSYPSLWGTPRLDLVQWNAVAENRQPYQRLGRNIGEALGVFARVNLRKPASPLLGYPSSVNVANQKIIEESLIHALNSPPWPSLIFGAVDPAKVASGSAVYKKYCSDCHKPLTTDWKNTPDDPTRVVAVKKLPLGDVGTDPSMAVNVACRMADTGTLAGTRQPPVIGLGHKLESRDFVVNLVSNVVVGVEEAGLFESAIQKKLPASHAELPTTAQSHLQLQNIPIPFRTSTLIRDNCMQNLEVYKAGPLWGIWATAPYLHNGSVPNLYQLLLPADQRLKKFWVGSREFDAVNVGFDYTTGTFELDTTIKGNSNGGHEYGTQMTDEQRRQLIDYLKTL